MQRGVCRSDPVSCTVTHRLRPPPHLLRWLRAACTHSYAAWHCTVGERAVVLRTAMLTHARAGPLCQVCATGFARKGLSAPCSVCEDGGTGWGFWLLLLFALGGVGAFLFGLYILSKGTAGDGDGDQKKSLHVTIFQKIIAYSKILIGLFQVLSQLESCLDLKFPYSFAWLVEVMR